uniref:Putative profilin family protein n=1 Tax=Tanacetum cinerariifolium TaxID=118510 RepID=A0A6L2LTV1_TANCI|nr:putative profilin family protein [Tanacetum cinerariifolium]
MTRNCRLGYVISMKWIRRIHLKPSIRRIHMLDTPNRSKIDLDVCSAEEEGIEADPIEVSQFVNFVKRCNYQSESFFINSNQYIVTSIHESWFCGRCMDTSNPAGEGAIVFKTSSFLFVALYEGSIGAASRAMAAADLFAWQLERRNL